MGREAVTGHHFSVDGMPFEMALVQYSFQGLSRGINPKNESLPSLQGGAVFSRLTYEAMHKV